jgi:hypothetical protein
VAGTCVDSRDHVFIVNARQPRQLAGDARPVPRPGDRVRSAGNVVNAWGDRNVLPNGIHGCFVDYQDNVWIAGNGDGIVQKYTHDGSAAAADRHARRVRQPAGQHLRQLGREPRRTRARRC